jgi:hypothetical protein
LDVIVCDEKRDLIRIGKDPFETAAECHLEGLMIKDLGEDAFFFVWLGVHISADSWLRW